MRRLLTFLCGMAAFLAPASAKAGWLEAETPHFRLYSDGREETLRKVAAKVEDYDQVLRIMTNTATPISPVKLDIYLLKTNADLRKVRPVAPNVAGFYSATPGYIAAFAIENNINGLGRDDTLFHEYAHHFMWQYYPAAYPAWYVEGFAEFMMTANIADKVIEVGRFNDNRAYWLVMGSWLPIHKILDGSAEDLKGEQVSMFYAQSWLIVHWAFSNPERSRALGRYLQARGQGVDGPTAFKREMGMDYPAFTRELRKYIRTGRISYIRFARSSDLQPVPVKVRSLSPAADDLLLPRAAVMLGMSDELGAKALPVIRKSAARYPADSFAKWTLAAYEMDFGDARAGSALVDALIAGGMTDAETLFLRGYGDLVAGRKADSDDKRRPHYDAARQWFNKAFHADQNYFPALWAYVETRSLDPMDENTLSVLMKAQELAPQVESLRFQAAVALMRNKEFAVAARTIAPLAADPHGGAMAEYAQQLLAKARSGQFTEADLQWKDAVAATAKEGDDDGGSTAPAGESSRGEGPGESKGAAPTGAAPR